MAEEPGRKHPARMLKADAKIALGKRVAYARERANLNQTELGKALKLTRSAVSQWESGRTEPSAENLREIAVETGVDYEWLATGRGPKPLPVSPRIPAAFDKPGKTSLPAPDVKRALRDMRDAHVRSEDIAADLSSPKAARRDGGIVEWAPRAGMGGGGEAHGLGVVHDGDYADPVKPEVWHFPSRFTREELQSTEANLAILETRGDSMAPTLHSGDRVVIDTSHRVPSPDGIYAIRDGYGLIVVKRLQTLLRSNPPRIRIISDNTANQPEEVDAEEFQEQIVGRVLWGIKRL